MDRRGRDQFVIRYGDETEVSWNDHQKALAEQVSTALNTASPACTWDAVPFSMLGVLNQVCSSAA